MYYEHLYTMHYALYIHSSDCVKIVIYVCFALHLFHLFIIVLPFLETLFALDVFLPNVLHWFSSLNAIFPLTSQCDYMTFKAYRFLPHNFYRWAPSTSLLRLCPQATCMPHNNHLFNLIKKNERY